MSRRVLSTLVTALALACIASAQEAPSEAAIRSILATRLDTMKQGMGLVVGVVDAKGRRIVAHGRSGTADTRPLDGRTVFEIGSVTKVFTSVLLADMVQRGEVSLTDPVAKHLPGGWKVPERQGRVITLRELSNHTSGLPRLPLLFPKDPKNPYADYTPDMLKAYLDACQLPRDIGARYEYSNLGTGLLGRALAHRAKTDYENLVQTRITSPLGMKDTRITLDADQKARAAQGHDESRTPVPMWDLPTLAGAGALRSTAEDMLTFLSAHLGYRPSPLAPAMAAMASPRTTTSVPGLSIALGWHVSTEGNAEVIWHNGETGGFQSFLGYNPRTRIGVVILSNGRSSLGLNDLGMHLLDKSFPLAEPRKARKEVTVAPAQLEGLVGRYELAPQFILTITQENDALFAQATGQPRLRLHAEGPRAFFLKEVDAQITFDGESGHKAPSLVLHQNGQRRAKRVD